jgi:MYXO-CTERM domain-containing protein
MAWTLRQLHRAIPLAAALAVPDVALAEPGACGDPYYDPCLQFSGWTALELAAGGTIPADGVLVLQGAVQGEPPPGPDSVTLEVTEAGAPVAGALEATDLPGLLVWRPAAAWTPGATYQVVGAAQNPAEAGECLPAGLPIAGEVTIDAAPVAALTPVELSGAEDFQTIPLAGLQSIACCPGASPTVDIVDCGQSGGLSYDPAQCAATQGFGYLDLALEGTPAVAGPTAQQVVYVLRGDGVPEAHASSPAFALAGLAGPTCAAIDAVDLGSGALVPGVEACFGEAFADQFGEQPLDPTEVLACDPVVCQATSEGWDVTMCSPWDGDTGVPTEGGPGGAGEGGDTSGQDGEKACACDASRGPGPGLLALVGALALARRRRRV